MSIDTFAPPLIEAFDESDPCAGVLFADDFDAPPPAPPPPPEPAPTASDLAAARAEAHQAGRDAGYQAARAEIAAASAAALAAAADALTALLAEAQAAARAEAASQSRALAATLRDALAACLPSLNDKHGPAEARALTEILFAHLLPELHLTLRCAPATRLALAPLLARLGAEADQVALLVDPALAPGDLHLTWNQGEARRDADAALAAALATLIPSPEAAPSRAPSHYSGKVTANV